MTTNEPKPVAYCQHEYRMGQCDRCEREVVTAIDEHRAKGHSDSHKLKKLNAWQQKRFYELLSGG